MTDCKNEKDAGTWMEDVKRNGVKQRRSTWFLNKSGESWVTNPQLNSFYRWEEELPLGEMPTSYTTQPPQTLPLETETKTFFQCKAIIPLPHVLMCVCCVCMRTHPPMHDPVRAFPAAAHQIPQAIYNNVCIQ